MARKKRQTVIVGAGPAGVGVAAVLQRLGVDALILDREAVGASFARWPREMRLITPSFPTNSFGTLDLNSIAIGTSPGYSLRKEHPSGLEYAAYLQAVADHFRLNVRTGVDVEQIEPLGPDEGFRLRTSAGTYEAGQVVWAGGEFGSPSRSPFPGAEHGCHTGDVRSWGDLEGSEFVVIGGYESGVDAAVSLVELGKRVRVLDRRVRLGEETSDPSGSLSPRTIERLAGAQRTGRLEVVTGADIVRIERKPRTFAIVDRAGNMWRTSSPPILATGFEPSVRRWTEYFTWRDDGCPFLNEHDESTLVPGLFLVGPSVRHEQHIFCFIYKFRQRFPVVAARIAERLGVDPSPLEEYRRWGMYLDDLSCCGQECVC
jgi:putative flavoprotein involved in K+ transport